MIGKLVMEAWASIDQVAYYPFRFRLSPFPRAKDFGEPSGQITADDD
jgi:hypothetical protein